MKRTLIILTGLLLAGCATSGKVTDNRFIDSKYPISCTFPKKYEIKTAGENGAERVSAVEYKQETDIVQGLILLKPVFVVSVFDSIKPFADFIKEQSGKHFEARYYFNYQAKGQQDMEIRGAPVHLELFTSKVSTAGDYIVSIKGDNRGITGFIDHGAFYLKLEYIANTGKYRQEDFQFVLNNIILTK